MKQRHRQWLAAMALTFPACSDSYSSNVLPPSLVSKERIASLVDTPNMFLSSRHNTIGLSLTKSRFGGRATSGTPVLRNDDNDNTLGFDTRLHLLDSSKWNNVREMDLSASSPIKSQVAASLFRKSSLAWLPWIPSPTQIRSLKLLELKQACAERGLKKVCH